jgi:hypothetical protein
MCRTIPPYTGAKWKRVQSNREIRYLVETFLKGAQFATEPVQQNSLGQLTESVEQREVWEATSGFDDQEIPCLLCKIQGLMRCSQQIVSASCTEPDVSNPYVRTIILYGPLGSALKSIPWCSK